jgi:hypothetical protein
MCHNAPPRAENAFLWLRFGEGWQATACIEDLAIWHGLAVECLASPPLAIAGCWLVPRTPRTYNSCLGSRYGGAEHLYPLVPIWSICACTCITLTFLLWRDGSSRMTPKTQHRNSKKEGREETINHQNTPGSYNFAKKSTDFLTSDWVVARFRHGCSFIQFRPCSICIVHSDRSWSLGSALVTCPLCAGSDWHVD